MTTERRAARSQPTRRARRPAASPDLESAAQGISNQPADVERAAQERLPAREVSTEPGWTRDVGETEAGELIAQTAADVMTSPPTALDVGEPIAAAARAMRDGDIGDVLVTENGRLVGILTDRDVVVRVLAEGRNPATTVLGAVCSRELATLSPRDAIDTAVARMRERVIRRLPVVEDGRPSGIVALGDLAVERDRDSLLGAISAAPATR